ncbi:MAG: BrnT family toxin [Bradyrhizobium sp.]
MTITFDPQKRAATLAGRGLDFADAGRVFEGDHATWIDDRFDYGEVRRITAGWLDGRMVVFVWTTRGTSRHVISMRYCHAKEERKIRRRFAL